ncbi:MAG TPA: 2-dehydropantoate 2-reductase [Stellaceae bacterium]|nr:2-dehydropantoate 2-reductase [Stellaceae bacterium]
MRILVVGAGAIGGYFGGRLLEAGCDVTFLVRPRRAAELAAGGLVLKSALGDFTKPAPATVLARDLGSPFDLILLSCKAYSLDDAIDSFAPAVGPNTAILPLLNGMRHLDVLDERFGKARVFGGQCGIAATLDPQGQVVHLNRIHELSFGERDGGLSDRVQAIARQMQGAKFEVRASENILQEMWNKWVFLSALAASTCLMRTAIGDIAQAPGGTQMVRNLIDESRTIAEANGFAPPDAFMRWVENTLTETGSTFTASMARDIENHNPIEADHIIGDLIRRGEETGSLARGTSLLRLAYTHLKAYEAREERTRSGR